MKSKFSSVPVSHTTRRRLKGAAMRADKPIYRYVEILLREHAALKRKLALLEQTAKGRF